MSHFWLGEQKGNAVSIARECLFSFKLCVRDPRHSPPTWRAAAQGKWKGSNLSSCPQAPLIAVMICVEKVVWPAILEGQLAISPWWHHGKLRAHRSPTHRFSTFPCWSAAKVCGWQTYALWIHYQKGLILTHLYLQSQNGIHALSHQARI